MSSRSSRLPSVARRPRLAFSGDSAVITSGDRLGSAAGRETVNELASLVRKRAKALHVDVDVDAVHDMRTATRRLRTAIALHGQDARGKGGVSRSRMS